MLDGNLITIGDNVLLGPRVGLYTANHALDPQERLMGGCYAHPIVIEDNVWVGAGVHIMGGVTVGGNSVIGAGSVVTKSIPENVIAAGVPCKVIREITDEDKTGFLPWCFTAVLARYLLKCKERLTILCPAICERLFV